jgi:hypothetical protein
MPGMSERTRFVVTYSICMTIAVSLAVAGALDKVRYKEYSVFGVSFCAGAIVFAGLATFLRLRYQKNHPESLPLPYLLGVYHGRWRRLRRRWLDWRG